MITVAQREELRSNNTGTARFEGVHHDSGISLFWVDELPGHGPDTHWHPYTETWTVLKGKVHIEAGGQHFHVEAGAIVTVPAETRHRFRSEGTVRLEMICIHASPEIIQTFV